MQEARAQYFMSEMNGMQTASVSESPQVGASNGTLVCASRSGTSEDRVIAVTSTARSSIASRRIRRRRWLLNRRSSIYGDAVGLLYRGAGIRLADAGDASDRFWELPL